MRVIDFCTKANVRSLQEIGTVTCNACGELVTGGEMCLSDADPSVILAYELQPCGHNAPCTVRFPVRQ